MSRARFPMIVGLALATAGAARAQDFPAAEYVIVPLRVHVLTSPGPEMANCRLTEADMTRVIGNLNAIWHKAGIHFGVESVVREPAGQVPRFRATVSARGGELDIGDLRMLLPRGSPRSTACTFTTSTSCRSTAPTWATMS